LKNPAIEYTVQDADVGCTSSEMYKLPGKLLIVKALPSEEEITLTLVPKSPITTPKIEYGGVAQVLVKAREGEGFRHAETALFLEYLTYKFAMSDIWTSASCENCDVHEGHDIISVPPYISYSFNSGEQIAEDETAIKALIDFTYTYQPPDDTTKSSYDNNLYLVPTNTRYPYFQEVDEKTFEESSP
jgi:hypothetical protein